MNPTFDLRRLGFFMKRQLHMNLNSLGIALAAVIGTLVVITALFAYFNRHTGDLENLRNLYLVVFFAGGYIFTSMVFNEMHSPKKSYAFLTLPASKLEKLLAAWLVSSPVYVLLYAIVFVLLVLFSTLIANRTDALPRLFDMHLIWTCIKVFLVTQTLFFLGATAFRGNNFLKTLLGLFVFVLIISLYSGLLGYLLFGRNISEGNFNFNPGFISSMEYIFRVIIPLIFWYLLGPFLLIVSYFKLKERQV